jgi:hypothetical protein
MSAVDITIEDGVTPELQRLMSRVTRRTPMMQAAGKAVEVVLHRHFDRRDAEGNKQGWPRKHFWSRTVRRATAFETATDDEATVKIASREFMQKLYGGTITAPSGKFLAIPLTARAYAAGRPRNWGGGVLRPVRFPSGKLVLREVSSSLKTRASGGEAQYLLVKRVNQQADPRALPSETMMLRAARIAMRAHLEGQS